MRVSSPSEQPDTRNLFDLDMLTLLTAASLATLKTLLLKGFKKGNSFTIISLFSQPKARYSKDLESLRIMGLSMKLKFFS